MGFEAGWRAELELEAMGAGMREVSSGPGMEEGMEAEVAREEEEEERSERPQPPPPLQTGRSQLRSS